MRVFITGGTGLLGSHVAERLRRNGHEVTALCRPGADTTHLASVGCTVVDGDLGDPPEAHALRMDGCDAVLHAAAHIYGGPNLDVVRRVNVEGTRNVLEGACRARVSHAVHISSVAVYGDAPAPMDEDNPLDAPLRSVDYYGRTKREAEGVASSFHGREGLSVTILRPPAIYGERDRLFVPKLMAFLKRPVVFLLGSGDTRLASVYAGNLAEAVERALEGRGAGERLNVTEDVPVTQRTLYGGLARAMGRSPRFVSIPAAAARTAAAAGDAVGITIPGARDLSLTRSVRLATHDNPYPAEKARRALGWSPPYTLDEALSRTADWVLTRS